MSDGPEQKGFAIYKWKCTSCKWFRREPHPDMSGQDITACYHPVFNQGPFPGYSLGGNDDTPVDICPYLRKGESQ